MNPFLISFFKILGGILGLMFWAAIKWSKDKYKYRVIKESNILNAKIFPISKRLLYDDAGGDMDAFMAKHHPQKINYMEEIWLNAFRPVYILMVVQIFYYHNVILYLTFFIIIILLVFIAELVLDSIYKEKWYKISVLILWILTFLLIAFSETQVNLKTETGKIEQQHFNDSLVLKKDGI